MTKLLSLVRRVPVFCVATLAIAACSGRASPPAPQPAAAASTAELEPADEHLAALYRQSCKVCHAVGAGGAPVTGDRVSWDPRWEKGMEALRLSTVAGVNGMPPGGQCFACSMPEYEALIAFMAGRGGH